MISKPSLPNKQEGSLSQLLCCSALLLLYNGSTRELFSPRNVDLIRPILKFSRLNQIYIDSAAIIMYSNNAQEEKCIIITPGEPGSSKKLDGTPFKAEARTMVWISLSV